MPYLAETIRAKIREAGDAELIEDLESNYAGLIERQRKTVHFGDPAKISEQQRACANIELIQQAQIHRTERLMFSCGTMLVERNVYGLVLMVRAHLESTAILGFLCDQLTTLSKDANAFQKVAFNIAYCLMGAKHEIYKDAPNPINILTCIEKADKYFQRTHTADGRQVIRDCYNWLSEFAHPNFNSHEASFRLDKEMQRFELLHGHELLDVQINLLGYLQVSSSIFLMFYDELGQLSLETLRSK